MSTLNLHYPGLLHASPWERRVVLTQNNGTSLTGNVALQQTLRRRSLISIVQIPRRLIGSYLVDEVG